MLLAVNFPSWLKPEIIPGLPLRWYGLMYIVAFGIAFLLYKRQVRERHFPMTEDQLSGLFIWGIVGLMLGARIFYFLVYDTEEAIRAPWLIFWPFRNGRLVGFAGMSYHGGVIGTAIGVALYSWRKKFDLRELYDMFVASIPLGYTFGRLGNFINGELYGRISTGPFAMIFPQGGIYPSDRYYNVILREAEQMGLDFVRGDIFYPPRHPSQLYEALFEGIVLWAIIWLFRNRKPFKGFLVFLYVSGYGLIRFFIEYFREPDSELGYRIEFVRNNLPPALAHPLTSFSTGQILCLIMIFGGILWALIASRLPDREPVRVYPDLDEKHSEDKKTTERKQRRKLHSKLK
ncbi:MAG: prolipoprotein diacylglyceryl transferase [Treponema sp.]|jgi:phosphatidylglycerol:prolipoprotein diacylglycerol transferase|nr:prolipoprotein diacylglyceryl transferase [Treponema sp.]